jgi:hypothetical protein
MRICPKCKTEYPDDKKFCKDCRVQLLSIQEGDSNISSNNIDSTFKSSLLNLEPFNNGKLKLNEPIAEKKEDDRIKNNESEKTKRNKNIIILLGLVLTTIAVYFIINASHSQKPLTDGEITAKENTSEQIPEKKSDVNNTNSSSASIMPCLMEWHNSMGNMDYDNHIKYYAHSVKYFNKIVDLNYIIKEKSIFFKSGTWQKISNDISNIRTESINDNKEITYFNYDCEFIKNTGRVFSVNVDKMIVWDKIDGNWLITEERDVKLNNNRSHK